MPPEYKHDISLLITDLDNTLWDWFHAWYASFDALLSGLVREIGVPREQLEVEIRAVHQSRGTSEYSWLLYELPSVAAHCGDRDPFVLFDKILHEQNSARLHQTRLYDGVLDTLQYVRKSGVRIVAYTESQAYWTKWRITKLGLDGVLDCLYSSPDHDGPLGLIPSDKRYEPQNDFSLRETEHRHVHRGLTKPNKVILEDILAEHGTPVERVAYIGDSLLKDVAMAQSVGVLDVHARYGEAQERPAYEQLRRVSHWTNEDIERERSMSQGPRPVATFTAREGFHELVRMFSFKA